MSSNLIAVCRKRDRYIQKKDVHMIHLHASNSICGPHDIVVKRAAVMVSLRLASLKMAVHLRSLCSFARLSSYAKWSFSSRLKSGVKAAQVYQGTA